MRRMTLICCLAAVVAAGMSAPAVAARRGGIGDQNASSFSDPHFRALGVKRTRLIVPYDAIFKSPGQVDQWVKAALAAKLEPLIAFNPSQGSHCPAPPCSVPSTKAYTRAFKAWRKEYPKVKLLHCWNETNSATPPTGATPASTVKKADQLSLAAKPVCRPQRT